MNFIRRMKRASFRQVCLFGFALVLIAGCGGSGQKMTLVPVTGKCLFKGKPAVNAQIIFHPLSRTAEWEGAYNPHGTVQSDGSFQVSTYKPNDGAPAGEYKIQITWFHNPNSKSQDPESSSAAVDRLGDQYSAEKTPLKITVSADQPALEPFQLN
jgi:hypothetical protein